MVNGTDAGPPGPLLQGRYAVGAVLGRGGMGTVYRGTDLVLEREVALKIFHSDVADAAELLRQQSEIRLLARLNHHGLVTLFDAGTAVQGNQQVPFLVMELVEGNDLHRLLRAGPLPGKEAARMGAVLAGALQYIHHHGVVHRDIKPANILLARYAEGSGLHPKLADFGIARMLDDARLTATNTTPGTAAYLSPEQAGGTPVGPPTDIYSLGLVLLEALTGKSEFTGAPMEAAVARLSRDPAIPDGLGPNWKRLLTAMTAREPAQRPDAGRVAEMLGDGGEWSAAVAGTSAPEASAGGPPQQTRVLPTVGRAHRPARAGGVPAGDAVPARILPELPDSEATNATSWRPAPPSRPPGSARPGARATTGERYLPGLLQKGGRRMWLVTAVLAVAVVVMAVAFFGALQRPAPVPAQSPGPVVPGQLGEDFNELEESVRP